jgi:hypothetical protein
MTKPEWNHGSSSTRVPRISTISALWAMRVMPRSASEPWNGERRGRGTAAQPAARSAAAAAQRRRLPTRYTLPSWRSAS